MPSAKPALDVIDRVDQPRTIHLDLPSPDDPSPSPARTTRLLSFRSTSEHHGQFGLVLLGIEQFSGSALNPEIASSPRLMVPEIGQVSTRRR